MRLNFFTTPIILLILLSLASARAQQRDSNSSAATVGGRVTIGGKPAARVVVILYGYGGSTVSGPFSVETDAKGRFKITGLAPGAYEIRPHAYVFVLPNQSPYAGANRRIVVRAGETIDDISIELVRGAVVTGRVVDKDGRPVVGDHVRLLLLRGDNPPPGSGSPPGVGETDDRGVYRLFGVPPGRYLVAVNHRSDGDNSGNGGGWGSTIFYPNTTDPDKAKVIEVSAGEEKTEINITVVLP